MRWKCEFSLFFLIFIHFTYFTDCSDHFFPRHKRAAGLVDFCRTIRCATGNPCWWYNNYGCYCGWGGHGEPVDDIDKCCLEHDQCYKKCRRYGCSVKWRGYQWTCLNNTVYCGSENSICGDFICECDQKASKCFAKHFLPNEKPSCVLEKRRKIESIINASSINL